jgi:2-deoxy-D-gluconate 3-dehydrogenase
MSWGPFDLSGKVAIVTGGAMGIGFGIAQRLHDAGASVLIADLDEKAAHTAAAKLGPERAAAIAADVSAEGAGEQMVRRCVEKFGRVDVLVNNAGIYPQVPMMKMKVELFDQVWKVNLRGLVLASRAAARQMIEQGSGGTILNISSVDAFHPSMVGLAAYDASKGAVNMFTRSFALELAPHRIRVVGIAPGGVTTEGTSRPLEGSGMSPEQLQQMMDGIVKAKIPMGRMGTPDDIAWPAVFLVSGAAGYVTGSTLVIDGGMLLA